MKIIKPYIRSAVMFHMKQFTKQRQIFEAIIWKRTMKNLRSFINATDIYAGDQSSGLSGTLFIFFVYFFPFPATASLMLRCCFIGNAKKINLFCHSLNANTIKGLLHCLIWLKRVIGRTSRLYLWSVFPFCCGDTDVFLFCLPLLRLDTYIIYSSSF